MYSNDPIYPEYRPVTRVRVWPLVLVCLLFALAFWAYLEPIPEHTRLEPISLGPNSPLYGPLK